MITKVDELDVDKLKTVPGDLKKLSDVVDKKAVKNKKFNTLKTKVNNSEEKIPDLTTLIHINQDNTYNQYDQYNNTTKMEILIKKYQTLVD